MTVAAHFRRLQPLRSRTRIATFLRAIRAAHGRARALQRPRSMSTVILTATHSHPALHELVRLVRDELGRAGEDDVRSFELGEIALGSCRGELDCGRVGRELCELEEAEQQLVEAIHDAHNLVLVDEVTFGGHGSVLKQALDRLLCMLLPCLARRVTITQHGVRFERPFAMFAVGFAASRNVPMADTFRSLADANALNFVAPHVGSDVFVATEQALWPEQLGRMFDAAHAAGDDSLARASSRSELVQLARADTRAALPAPRSAALLVGTAKQGAASTSECLARASAERLSGAGLRVHVHHAAELAHDARLAERALHELCTADLLQLVTPLYVDALPGPATRVLEQLAHMRARSVPPARFSMVVQSGSPEPEHNRHAVAIARHFAASAGYHWSGALVLGGAGVIDRQLALDAQPGSVDHVRRGLDLACAALARGGVIEGAAIQAALRTPFPTGMARSTGQLGFRLSALEGALGRGTLRDKPVDGPRPPTRRGAKRARANA
jgi:multimeric flavodoxin WrbA